jgi:putative endonuclease
MFYTYILKSLKDGRRYIGHTDNLDNRLRFHNKGLNPSTKNRRPLVLLCYKQLTTRIEASRYERYLKRLKGGKQLEGEINVMVKYSVGTPQTAGHGKE